MQRSHYGLMVFITAFPRSLVWITLASIQLSEHSVCADDITRVSVSPVKGSPMSSVQLEWNYTDDSNKVYLANLLYGTSVNDTGFIVDSALICAFFPTGPIYYSSLPRYLGRVSFKWSSLHITVNISDVTVNDTGYYSLLMKSSDKKTIPGLTSKGIQVIIQKTPPIQTTIKSDAADNKTTSGTDVNLTCTTISYFETNFTFHFNDDPLTTNQNGVLEIKNVNQSHEGTYTCKASNKDGSDVSNILFLVIVAVQEEHSTSKNQLQQNNSTPAVAAVLEDDKLKQSTDSDVVVWKAVVGVLSIIIVVLILIILWLVLKSRLQLRQQTNSAGSGSGHTNEHGEILLQQPEYAFIQNLQNGEALRDSTEPNYEPVTGNQFYSSSENIPTTDRTYQQLQPRNNAEYMHLRPGSVVA